MGQAVKGLLRLQILPGRPLAVREVIMSQGKKQGLRGISGNQLKVIAIIAMFMDHVGACILPKALAAAKGEAGVWRNGGLASRFFSSAGFSVGELENLYFVLRTIGRITFPIMAFLLVEGFFHTRNVKKYGARLLCFAFLSEIPFDLVVSGRMFYWGHQNIFFTLFLCLMVLFTYETYRYQPFKQAAAAIGGAAAAVFLAVDYDFMAVLLVLVLYTYYGDRKGTVIYGGLICAAMSIGNYGAAALAFLPIALYGGERGKWKMKYFFYCFYPLHLVIIYLAGM